MPISQIEQVETYNLFRHQRQMVRGPWQFPDINYFFDIGGYGSAKTTAAIFLILRLIDLYGKYQIKIAIFGTTITLLKKTLIADLENIWIRTNTPYRFNKSENLIHIGQMILVLIGTEQPNAIYSHNVCASICDELDELTQLKALDAFKAIGERTRITFPDGRSPFQSYFTTAQGYRGTYQIIEGLRERRTNYMHVRGLTIENTHNDPSYYTNLYDIYNENEREAFLNGRFVNLQSGRVYPDYDESLNMVDDFPIEPTETIMIGQDLNSGYSKALAVVQRGERLYAVKEFNFKVIGHAPKILRQAFPTNRIQWFPDASAKMIIEGYRAELQQYGIELNQSNFNPNVLDRIFMENKLFSMNRLSLFRSLKDLPMALKTRQYNDAGDPEKGAGERAPDHICDATEYVVSWAVAWLPEFRDLYTATRTYAREGVAA